MRALAAEQSEIVTKLVEQLADGDLFITAAYSSLPGEMRENGWPRMREAVASAAVNGATIIYLTPCQKLLDPLGLRRVYFDQGVRSLRTSVAERNPPAGRRGGKTEDAIADYEYTANSFMVPQLVVSLLRIRKPGRNSVLRGLMFPEWLDRPLWVPDSGRQGFLDRFVRFVESALESHTQTKATSQRQTPADRAFALLRGLR